MNRIRKNITQKFVIFIWIVTAALFADAANLDDFISGGYTVHDEVDDAGIVVQGSFANIHSSCNYKISPGKSVAHLRQYFDQDSPSTLALDFTEIISSSFPVKEKTFIYDSYNPSKDLYLQFHSLII